MNLNYNPWKIKFSSSSSSSLSDSCRSESLTGEPPRTLFKRDSEFIVLM